MTTASDPIAGLARALDATKQIVAGIDGEQWTAPTGCPEWNVRELLNHLVGGDLVFAALLTGKTPPDWTVDHLDGDPLAAYRGAAETLRVAFGQPGALDTVVTVPFGTVPGRVALHLRITEILVHGWDLARATGQATHGFPADLAEQELEFSRRALGDIPPDRSPFAAPQPVDDDAPAIDRLAALLGRRITSHRTQPRS